MVAAGPARASRVTLVDPELAERVIERALARGGDFAELYAEDGAASRSRSTTGASSARSRPRARRLGARGGGRLDLLRPRGRLAEAGPLRVADSVAQARARRRRAAGAARPASRPTATRSSVRPGTWPARKADLLRACDERARAAGARSPRCASATRGAPPGRGLQLRRPCRGRRPHARAPRRQVVARRDDRVETGTDTRGGHAGFELLEADPEAVADEAARKALTMLDAVDAPTGPMPVVVGNGFGGVLLHEATGHGLEADAVQKRASVYAGRLGEQLAEPFVTAYDDGRRANEWGSDGIDDEGTPTQRTTVIEDGRADLLPLRPDARAQGRRRVHRQRAARVLPPPADPAHDEHLLRARATPRPRS